MGSATFDADVERTGRHSGLTDAEVRERRARFGVNEVPEQRTGPVRGTLRRLWGPVPWLLEAAMVFELVLGKGIQAAFVFLLLLFSAITGEIQESRAKTAIGYLHRQLQITTRTLRNGAWGRLPARDIVPDDVVHVRVGDIVPADVRIVDGNLSVDESAISGESIDVARQPGEVVPAASTVSHGEAIATVTAIGPASSYGRTTELARTAEAPGRLQVLLFTIVRYLAYLDVVLALVLVVAALVRGTSWQDLLPFLVILFIATIPISMPSSFTVANSLEARTLATQGVLVTGLSGIQEAATMDVLLVDKTGTLTKNRPEITAFRGFGGTTGPELLRCAMAATDGTATDTISAAITRAYAEQGWPLPRRLSFTGFDPVRKVSSALLPPRGEGGGVPVAVVLGSPAVVAEMADIPADFATQVDALGAQGARTLVVASGEAEGRLACRGLIALADAPRDDARAALEQIRDLGIRTIMITGDTAATARAIAAQVGIGDRVGSPRDAQRDPLGFDAFADVYPEDKYAVVRALQRAGTVVGMTGDGINDAPALKQADVGIAVGSATDVAKSAARVVLSERGLSDIAHLIDSGHRVFRRMMTWTITKLARTAELAALLTLGFVVVGFFPVSLGLIVLIVIMNDLVTLTLGTDRAWPTSVPEKWDLPRLARISALFTVGWLAVGLALLWLSVDVWAVRADQVSSLMFVYLICSAMATVLMTRTRDAFWTFTPSAWVGGMIAVNVVVAMLLAAFGLMMAPVPWPFLLAVVAVTLAAMLVLDGLKVRYYRATGILGTERHLAEPAPAHRSGATR